ncbi:MAG TPA: plastocyanin/azurin family copper-binding protein [Acidimicrobiales bacterium]
MPADAARHVPGAPPGASAIVALATGVVVLALAGCGGGDDADLPAVEGPTAPRLEVRASEMSFAPDAVAVAAGQVEVVLHNEGQMLHDLRIGEEPFIVEAGAGQTATGSVALEPGRYEIYCSLPGHRDAGMEGVLEVR